MGKDTFLDNLSLSLPCLCELHFAVLENVLKLSGYHGALFKARPQRNARLPRLLDYESLSLGVYLRSDS